MNTLCLSLFPVTVSFVITHSNKLDIFFPDMCVIFYPKNQVKSDPEIRHNRPGSPQHEHVAAGIRAEGWKQDADVWRSEQGGLPSTPGGFQVNLIGPEGHSSIARHKGGRQPWNCDRKILEISSLDCTDPRAPFHSDDIRVIIERNVRRKKGVNIYPRMFKEKQSWRYLLKWKFFFAVFWKS